jgi:hypothetical protein
MIKLNINKYLSAILKLYQGHVNVVTHQRAALFSGV